MWKFVVKYGRQAYRYFWPAVKGGVEATRGAKVVRVATSLWRIGNTALTALFIWDLFGFGSEQEMNAEVLMTAVEETFLPKHVKMALAADLDDVEAIAFAAANTGINIIHCDETNETLMMGAVMISLSEYLTIQPFGTMRSPAEIAKGIKEEFVGAFEEIGLTEEEAAGLDEMYNEMDWDNMPPESLRNFDFMLFTFKSLSEAVDSDPDFQNYVAAKYQVNDDGTGSQSGYVTKQLEGSLGDAWNTPKRLIIN